MDEQNQSLMEWYEKERLMRLEIEAHLANWQHRLLHGQDAVPMPPQERQELAQRISTMLTYCLHGDHPSYAREDAVDEVLDRRPRINHAAWGALDRACTLAVGQEMRDCLRHWQHLALHGLVDEDYFEEAVVRRMLSRFADQLVDWLTFPVHGFHPWYDADDALRSALYFWHGGPFVCDEER